MKKSFGKKFQELRKQKNLTQESIAESLNVSPQAVSKWENDISYPDIELLKDIAILLGTTIDNLLSKEDAIEVVQLPKEERKNINHMLLKVIVNSNDGDKVRINLPLSIIVAALNAGVSIPQVSGNKNNDILKDIDFREIIHLVEQGVIGKLVEVESADGDIVEVVVE